MRMNKYKNFKIKVMKPSIEAYISTVEVYFPDEMRFNLEIVIITSINLFYYTLIFSTCVYVVQY
jgi:hypothetical protein